MDDNARRVQNVLEKANVHILDWPANSLDKIPIEHVWDMGGRAIFKTHISPITHQELFIPVAEEWNNSLLQNRQVVIVFFGVQYFENLQF